MTESISKWKVAVYVMVIVVVFLIGSSVGQRSMIKMMSVELNSVQGMLAFNRLLDERKQQLLLNRGCITQASYAVDIAQDKDMELLSEFFTRGQLDERSLKYIALRDPKLLSELKNFKSKYGNTWVEPECK